MVALKPLIVVSLAGLSTASSTFLVDTELGPEKATSGLDEIRISSTTTLAREPTVFPRAAAKKAFAGTKKTPTETITSNGPDFFTRPTNPDHEIAPADSITEKWNEVTENHQINPAHPLDLVPSGGVLQSRAKEEEKARAALDRDLRGRIADDPEFFKKLIINPDPAKVTVEETIALQRFKKDPSFWFFLPTRNFASGVPLEMRQMTIEEVMAHHDDFPLAVTVYLFDPTSSPLTPFMNIMREKANSASATTPEKRSLKDLLITPVPLPQDAWYKYTPASTSTPALENTLPGRSAEAPPPILGWPMDIANRSKAPPGVLGKRSLSEDLAPISDPIHSPHWAVSLTPRAPITISRTEKVLDSLTLLDFCIKSLNTAISEYTSSFRAAVPIQTALQSLHSASLNTNDDSLLLATLNEEDSKKIVEYIRDNIVVNVLASVKAMKEKAEEFKKAKLSAVVVVTLKRLREDYDRPSMVLAGKIVEGDMETAKGLLKTVDEAILEGIRVFEE